MTDAELMQHIKTNCGDDIARALGAYPVPPTFLAALIANESGGDPNAKRFERNVLFSLWEVLLGRKTAYGSIGRQNLLLFVAGLSAPPASAPQSIPADAFQRLDSLATSWGLTQIMGYHCLGDGTVIGGPAGLRMPANSLRVTLRLLADFGVRFHLNLAQDFESLFRCWNGGHPTAVTFDPNYVSNGMARMAIYQGLA